MDSAIHPSYNRPLNLTLKPAKQKPQVRARDSFFLRGGGGGAQSVSCAIIFHASQYLYLYAIILGLVYTSLLCRTYVGSNAIQTIDN